MACSLSQVTCPPFLCALPNAANTKHTKWTAFSFSLWCTCTFYWLCFIFHFSFSSHFCFSLQLHIELSQQNLKLNCFSSSQKKTKPHALVPPHLSCEGFLSFHTFSRWSFPLYSSVLLPSACFANLALDSSHVSFYSSGSSSCLQTSFCKYL